LPERERRARTPATPVQGPPMYAADFVRSSMNNNIE
jgi:hypothetical protein